MSIPKEPRQLMINLMYIVLTAMLALNVSAEVLNAFLSMNDSLKESSAIVNGSNEKLISAIETQADAYEQFRPLVGKAKQTKQLTSEFFDYVENIKMQLIDATGGYDENGVPLGIKNKDVPTRILVNEETGNELEVKIIEARNALLALIDEEDARQKLEQNIPLNVKPIPADSDKKSWAQFNFQQMPIAAVLPLLSKYQNDIKIAETSILNYFFKKTGMDEFKPDAFEAIISADKSYVINGESLNAEIFLGAYSSTADNISVTVNGRSVPVRDGKAIFNTRPSSIGASEFEAIIKVVNPVTKEEKTYRKKYRYEVGERSVTASADKMNVFYIGVDNPFSISAAGVPSDQVRVSGDGVNIRKQTNGKYNVTATRPGNVKITVSGGGLDPVAFNYRVKKIPTPVVKYGNKNGGGMSPGEMKVHTGLIPVLENFDFEARCSVVGFELTRKPEKNDAVYTINQGGRFSAEAKRIVNQATFGDTFFFDKIKVKCPGDEVSRKVNGLVFRIR